MSRLGVLGGTFNPPHLAHLICAQEAHAELALDRVLLVPVAVPPHKDAHDDPGAEHRVEMCLRAAAGDDRLEVSRIEVERGGPSYTVDTLKELNARAPADELHLIVGGDMAETLPAWREPDEILRLAILVVAERADAQRQRVLAALREIGGDAAAERTSFLDMPRVDISSSVVRDRVAAGRPIRYLVPEGVERYIQDQGLYQGARSRSAVEVPTT
jgi:nicotinate-nucleotide adenylyltransferase